MPTVLRVTQLMLILLSFISISSTLSAEELRVGVKAAAPFAMQDAEGNWSGVSVKLWREAADELELDWRFIPVDDISGIVDGLSDGSLDVGVGALSVTSEREAALDFTHPFYNAGVGIATRSSEAGLLSTLGALFSWEFFSAVSILIIVLLVVGVLIWLLERHKNPEQFGSRHRGGGIGAGFWWSAVTMTTVGYGDKAPITTGGRFLAVIWMFASIITISGFTAAIAAVFTVQSLNTLVTGPDDLANVKVVSVSESTGHTWLKSNRVRNSSLATVDEALTKLANGQAGAVVYDAPILRYLIQRENYSQLQVLDQLVTHEDYAFGLQQNSALRQRLNVAILKRIESEEWQETLRRHLGEIN